MNDNRQHDERSHETRLPSRPSDNALRLLRLHDELDHWTVSRGFGLTARTAGLSILAALIGVGVLRVGFEAGLGAQLLVILGAGGATIAGVQLWKRARIRALREEIEKLERSAHGRGDAPASGAC
jgi:hypothetical protein